MRDTQTAATQMAVEAEAILGEVRTLAEQAGAGHGTWSLATPTLPEVTSIGALHRFVATYIRETLGHQEWPLILRAWQFAREGKARELIALDQAWTVAQREAALAEASFQVGRRQLNKLRPLRHERVVQRYAAAIESGEARGWHPLVYGVTLAVFNLPLRPGLVHYAAQTLGGLVDSVARCHRLPVGECQALLEAANAQLPAALPPLPGLPFAIR
jgi:urease accessory protein UreF